MSDTALDEPKLKDLVNALRELEWGEVKSVCLNLGMEYHLFREVEENRSRSIERLQDSMHTWLSGDKVRPMWARLVTALRVSDKTTLANTVEQKYCKAVETPLVIQPRQNLSFPHSSLFTEQATVPPPPDPTTTAVSSSLNPPPLSSCTTTSSPSSNSGTSSFPPSNSTDLKPLNHSTSSPQRNRRMRRISPPAPPSPSPILSCDPQSDHPIPEATQPADLPGLQGKSTQPHPAKVRRELSRLQKMFSSVLAHTQNLIMKKEKKSDDVLTDLCTYLTTLPLAPGMLFLKKIEKDIENAKSVKEIFSILKLYWNYSNYYLLQDLTKEYGESPLQQEMENYVSELHRFEKATSVQTFKSVKKDWDHPPKLKTAILTLEKNESELTLYDIRLLKEDIANEAAIEKYALYLGDFHCSAVVLTLAFPHDGLQLFASALSQKFLAKHQITSVVVDDLPLEKYTQEYVKGLQLVRVSREGDETAVTSLLNSGVNPNFMHKGEKSALLWASLNGHTEVVRVLLDFGADIHVADEYGDTALILAAMGGNTLTVKALIGVGANPNIQDRFGRTALILATIGGHTLTVQSLISGGADLNIQDRDSYTAVMYARQHGTSDMVHILIQDGANPMDQKQEKVVPSAADSDSECAKHTSVDEEFARQLQEQFDAEYAKQLSELISLSQQDEEYAQQIQEEFDKKELITSLMEAAREGKTDVVEDLKGRGLDVNAQDMFQSTPLHEASEAGHLPVVQALLDRGANVRAQDEDGRTPLMHAAAWGRTDVVEELIKRGADMNAQNKDGLTALLIATKQGMISLVQILLQVDQIEVNTTDTEGGTPLMYAAAQGWTDVVEELIKRGADMNAQDEEGCTPLMHAAVQGRTDVVEELIKRGADMNAQDKYGDTAMMFAVHVFEFMDEDISIESHEKTVQLLIDGGANVNAQNQEGLTALLKATKQGMISLVQILLQVAQIEVNTTDTTVGWSALFYAVTGRYLEITRLLITAGADVLLKDKNEMTVLNIARLYRNEEIIEELTHHVTKQTATQEPTASQEQSPAHEDVAISQSLINTVEQSREKVTKMFRRMDQWLKSTRKKEIFYKRQAAIGRGKIYTLPSKH